VICDEGGTQVVERRPRQSGALIRLLAPLSNFNNTQFVAPSHNKRQCT
jgi:hypothetical protein